MFRSLLPTSVLFAVLVAACSGTGATPVPSAPPVTLAPATVPPASAAPSVAAGPTVSVSSAGFFVGPTGLTLYAFDKDTAGASNCQSGQCVANWPALVLPTGTQISVGTGLTATDFATIVRTDGTAQVTFKQVPLYNFAGDAKPGDKNGDGVGGIWHLATTSTVPPAASSAPSAAASTGTSKVCYDAYHYVIPCP